MVSYADAFQRSIISEAIYHLPPTCAKIITGCTVLHNMCIDKSVPQPDDVDNDDCDGEVSTARAQLLQTLTAMMTATTVAVEFVRG